MVPQRDHRGMTLSELLVVVMILGLLASVATMNLTGVFYRQTFKAALQDFIHTLELAAYAAAESENRYSVVIDMDEGTYLLRELANAQLYDIEDDEIIDQAEFGPSCSVLYVQFDDGEVASSGTLAHFIAGRIGWMYGGKVVIQNEQGVTYSVVINRLNKKVQLIEGDVDLLTPRDEESMLF
jgi:prepilin-type N-terminal cleavage/methylation domain-containing protein